MADTPGVDLDQYQKEKEEFADAMDDVFSEEADGKTDDEIIAIMDKKDKAAGTDVAGEAKKDLTKEPDPKLADKKLDDDSNLSTNGQGITDGIAVDNDTTPATVVVEDPTDVDGWKAKAVAAEAELVKEKQKTSSWNGRITAANTKVKELEANILELEAVGNIAKAKENDATTKSDNEVLDGFRKDFPELASAIDILQKRVDGVTTLPAKEPAAKPASDGTDNGDSTDNGEAVPSDHLAAIRKIHPDLSEMVNTGVLQTWIQKQPDFIRPALETIYTDGSSEDVINMVTEFKDKTSWKSQLATADDGTKKTDSKLNSMLEVNSETTTPDGKTVDKNDYDQGAKDAGL